MGDRKQHQLLYSSRFEQDRELEMLKRQVKKQVEEEKAITSRQSRSIRLSNIRVSVKAKMLAEWFQQYGEVVEVKLNALSLQLKSHDRESQKMGSSYCHNGSGVLEFASVQTVDKLVHKMQSMQGVAHHFLKDGTPVYSLSSALGGQGILRFHRHTVRFTPKAKLRKDAERNALVFKIKSLQFGNQLGGDRVVFGWAMGCVVEIWLLTNEISWELQYRRNRYRFELAFKHIAGKASLQPSPDGRAALLLPVRIPPKLYRLPLAGKSGETEDDPRWEDETEVPAAAATATNPLQWSMDPENWLRTVDFSPKGAIGSSFLYRFLLPATWEELQQDHQLLMPLIDCGILDFWSRYNPVDVTETHKVQLVKESMSRLPYNILYHLECMLTAGYVCEEQLEPKVFGILGDNRIPEEVLVQALLLIHAARRQVGDLMQLMRKLVKDILIDFRTRKELGRQLPVYCMMVGRALVTPTRIVRLPPETELSNRVLRQFKSHSQYFIRVSFGEENSGILHLGPNAKNKVDLIKRIRFILEHGLTIANRHFNFLAFSTSQLKERSAWFFSDSPELPLQTVRDFMGNFTNNRCVAKYAARMGQCFSSTIETVEVEEAGIIRSRDLIRNGHNFSDGCGLITTELAALVTERLKQHGRLNNQMQRIPCAYQLRFGGCKGVVVQYPGMLSGRVMQIRPSMEKFQSDVRKIEVVGVSRYLPAFLNRQLISILFQKSLGVPDLVFRQLQDAMLQTLNGMLSNSKTALHVLHDYNSIESNFMIKGVSSMIAAGFDVTREPFLRRVVKTVRAHLLQDLKNRTRIFVPKAALLMGVVDELNILQDGEVYLQVNSSATLDAPMIIKGPLIVAKNPCFHPGDIRVLKAIDVSGLEHLENVVIFSQRGLRPVPNEISGSDLDGDMFFCSWEKGLIPPRGASHPAMDYPAAIPHELDRDVKLGDVAQFFVDHAISDNLGIIANAHLAWADASELGVRDPRCLKLAEKHSQAVDFPKTGIVVEIDKGLRPLQYPDFMQNKHKPAYRSKTIIGQLFREIQDPQATQLNEPEMELLVDKDLIVENYELHLQTALVHRFHYEQELIQIMTQFNIMDEFQLITGCITQWDKMHKRRNGKRYDTKSHVVEAAQALQRKYLRLFQSEQLKIEGKETSHSKVMLEKASAWYMATYEPSYQPAGPNIGPQLYSFPWVLHMYLADIKNSKVNARSDAV